MIRRWRCLFSGCWMLASLAIARPALAEAEPPNCEPPQADEHLLLVRLGAAGDRDRLRLALPAGAEWVVCRYQASTVARLGGFPDLETADNWGRYLVEIGGLSAIVARPPRAQRQPPVAPTRPTPPPPRSQPAPSRPAPPAPPATPPPTAPPQVPERYAPQPLGSGYAVLVDYFQRPELAQAVRQVANAEVGLAAYFTRPYLLAGHTRNAADAQALLRALSDRGFSALVVDSRQVMLLTPRVSTLAE